MPPTRRLTSILRLLVALVALLQGVAPAAAAVAEGVLAERGRANPAVVHIEDGRQGTCAYGHPGDCAICGCIATFAHPPLARALGAASPPRLVPSGRLAAAAPGAGAFHSRARAPPVA